MSTKHPAGAGMNSERFLMSATSRQGAWLPHGRWVAMVAMMAELVAAVAVAELVAAAVVAVVVATYLAGAENPTLVEPLAIGGVMPLQP